MARIGLTAYLTYVSLNVFKKATDRSRGLALTIAVINVLIAEILGRKLIGRPVLPVSQDKVNSLQQDNSPEFIKKVKKLFKNDKNEVIPKPAQISLMDNNQQIDNKSLLTGNAANLSTSNISFKGNPLSWYKGLKAFNTMTSEDFASSMAKLKILDPTRFEVFSKDNKHIKIDSKGLRQFGAKSHKAKKIIESIIGPFVGLYKLVTKFLKRLFTKGKKEAEDKSGKYLQERLNGQFNTLQLIAKLQKEGKSDDEIRKTLSTKAANGYAYNEMSYDASKFSVWNRLVCSAATAFSLYAMRIT